MFTVETRFEEAGFVGTLLRDVPFSFGGDISGWPQKRVCSDGTNAYFMQDDKVYLFDGNQVREYLDQVYKVISK